MITESRTLKIVNKVIFYDDIRKMADIAHELYLKENKNSNDPNSKFLIFVACTDNSSFSSKDMSLFADNSPLLIKKIEKIKISASRSKPMEWDLQIEITQSEAADNHVVIISNDGIWVNGVLSKYQDLIAAFKPQNTFIKRHEFMLWLFGTIGIACIIGPIFNQIINFNPLDNDTEKEPYKMLVVQKILSVVVGLIMAVGPAMGIVEGLKKLWPSVELAIGPEHTQIEKKRRNIFGSFCVLVVIPIAINIIYDLLKYFTVH